MLVLAALVAAGTVIESRYNAEYSAMVMYKSNWFGLILILLWINIFCATISRIPFKKHHTGFVITHIGLLTLLIGGFITNSYGIDGQLSVQQGSSSSTVVLPGLMVGYQFENSPFPISVKMQKSIFEKNESSLSGINSELGNLFRVTKYIPFAKVQKGYKTTGRVEGDIAISFILKSNFFNVSEWLHTSENPQMQMGPATLKLVKVSKFSDEAPQIKKPVKKQSQTKPVMQKPTRSVASADNKLNIYEFGSGKLIKSVSVSDLKSGLVISGVKIELVKEYRAAVVSANKIEENLDPQAVNPALELKVSKSGQSLREILYGKFENFSLNKDGMFGLRFSYDVADTVKSDSNPHAAATADQPADGWAMPADHPAIESHAAGPSSGGMGNIGSRIIEFNVNPADAEHVQIKLYEDNKQVLSKIIKLGEPLDTPWMGMKIFAASLQVGAEAYSEVAPINPEKRSQLPPSAIEITTSEGNREWLAEGEQKSISIGGRNLVVYFGREFVELPFPLKLNKFTKADYPGTNTAMSYESLVEIGSSGVEKLISMNEPLKQSGFTIYQASYILNPGEPPVSVFSVNQDPGRWIKYLGSLILSIGVIIYTLMKSNFYKKKIKAAT